jgi:arylsulfatase A-like enzyme
LAGSAGWKSKEQPSGFVEETGAKTDWLAELPEASRKVYQAESADHVRRTTGGPTPRPAEHNYGRYIADLTARQLHRLAADSARFFAWCSIPEPHPPFRPPRELYARRRPGEIPIATERRTDRPHSYIRALQREWEHLTDTEWRQIIAAYYGMVELADGFVGGVLSTLDDLGLADETAVILTSDHGEMAGEHGMMLKFNFREGAVRVPLIIRAPEVAPDRRDGLVGLIDLFPTICDLMDVPVPETSHGRSLMPGSASAANGHDVVFCQYAGHTMVRTRESKLNLYDNRPGELFDLTNDPFELNNLIETPGSLDLVRTLVGRYQASPAATG